MYVPTVFENYVADVEVDNRYIELAIWDTAGQEDYDRLRPLSYPDSDLIMICFAIDNPGSFDNVTEKWNSEIRHFCRDVPVMLVGLKHDLREDTKTIGELLKTEEKPVTTEEGIELAKKMGYFGYYECSAKTNQGVRETWEIAMRGLIHLSGSSGKSSKQGKRSSWFSR